MIRLLVLLFVFTGKVCFGEDRYYFVAKKDTLEITQGLYKVENLPAGFRAKEDRNESDPYNPEAVFYLRCVRPDYSSYPFPLSAKQAIALSNKASLQPLKPGKNFLGLDYNAYKSLIDSAVAYNICFIPQDNGIHERYKYILNFRFRFPQYAVDSVLLNHVNASLIEEQKRLSGLRLTLPSYDSVAEQSGRELRLILEESKRIAEHLVALRLNPELSGLAWTEISGLMDGEKTKLISLVARRKYWKKKIRTVRVYLASSNQNYVLSVSCNDKNKPVVEKLFQKIGQMEQVEVIDTKLQENKNLSVKYMIEKQ